MKQTKCYHCPAAATWLVSSWRITDRPLCRAHVYDYAFSLLWDKRRIGEK